MTHSTSTDFIGGGALCSKAVAKSYDCLAIAPGITEEMLQATTLSIALKLNVSTAKHGYM